MLEKTFVNSRFLLFFISQSLVACGACIQLVAVAQLMLRATGSGLAAGFSIVGAPLAGFVFSLLAGSLGDRLNTKRLLVSYDVMRGLCVFLFIFCKSPLVIFAVMMLLNLLDVLYNPSKNKVLTLLLDKSSLVRGNSMLNGGYGAIYLVMPTLAGLLIRFFGVEAAFILGAGFYLLSSAVMSRIGLPKDMPAARYRSQRTTLREITDGINYCRDLEPVKRSMLALAALDFGTASVNIAMYAFAFDTLRVSSASWGLLLSVFYGMNVLSMALLLRFKQTLTGKPLLVSYLLVAGVAAAWIGYGLAGSFPQVLLGTAAEGLCSTLGSTVLVTFILQSVTKNYTARVMGVRDLVSSAAKIAGIAVTYLLMSLFRVDVVFISTALIVLAFTATQVVSLFRQRIIRR